jgi:lantibiotic modifying enzyme
MGTDAVGGIGNQTVFTDKYVDYLTGVSGLDWFLANTYKDSSKTETLDVITDLSNTEVASDSDLNKL